GVVRSPGEQLRRRIRRADEFASRESGATRCEYSSRADVGRRNSGYYKLCEGRASYLEYSTGARSDCHELIVGFSQSARGQADGIDFSRRIERARHSRKRATDQGDFDPAARERAAAGHATIRPSRRRRSLRVIPRGTIPLSSSGAIMTATTMSGPRTEAA